MNAQQRSDLAAQARAWLRLHAGAAHNQPRRGTHLRQLGERRTRRRWRRNLRAAVG